MDLPSLRIALKDLPVPQIEYYAEIGSTNDRAHELLEAGALDGSLVVADSQVRGRGRLGRHWVTVPGAALAFSLALRPAPAEQERLAFFAPLAGLAVCQALVEAYGLAAEVKWPNDVLLDQRKACGVLVEAVWEGSWLQGVVVGIGVNIAPSSVPPDSQVLFPATCVETALGQRVERLDLLVEILRRFFSLRHGLGSAAFLQLWQERLAFRGRGVRVDLLTPGATVTGKVQGVDQDGNLCLLDQAGKEIKVTAGDVHLRLLDGEG